MQILPPKIFPATSAHQKLLLVKIKTLLDRQKE